MSKNKENNKNSNIPIFGIQKLQKGNILNKQYSGTWGNRGQGNELQSALETGATWVVDKILNAGDYIDDTASYLVGLIPGGKYSANEMVENNRRSREAGSGQQWEDTQGELHINPTYAIPILPTLPANASKATIEAFNNLKRLRPSLAVRESQLKKTGLLHKLEETLPAKKYREAELAFKRTLEPVKKHTDPTPLTRKQKMAYKAEKARSMDDLRSVNSGRPAVRERQYDEIERMMRKDPKAAGIVQRYDRKVAQGMDYKVLRVARIKMLLDYIKTKPGFFDWLK